MGNAAVGAVYQIILVVGFGTFLTGLLLGVLVGSLLWRYKATTNKALPTGIPGEPIDLLIPVDDAAQCPLNWQHLRDVEEEQAL